MKLRLHTSGRAIFILLGVTTSLLNDARVATLQSVKNITQTVILPFESTVLESQYGKSAVYRVGSPSGAGYTQSMPLLSSRDLSPPKDVGQIRGRILNLQNTLKAFIHDKTFDYIEFEKRASAISVQFFELEHAIDSLPSGGIEVSEMFESANKIFDSMQDAIPKLKFFRKNGGRDQVLVHNLIQMNISMWKLYDPIGLPDINVPEFSVDVHQYSMKLKRFNNIYHTLSKVPLIVQSEFTRQRKSATRKLRVLVNPN